MVVGTKAKVLSKEQEGTGEKMVGGARTGGMVVGKTQMHFTHTYYYSLCRLHLSTGVYGIRYYHPVKALVL